LRKNIKKESMCIELKEVTMSKQLLFYVVKDELLRFYLHKATDLEINSYSEREKLLNLLQDLAYGKYNKLIEDQFPDDFPFDCCYNAKIVIKDDLKDYGIPELEIILKLSWMEKL